MKKGMGSSEAKPPASLEGWRYTSSLTSSVTTAWGVHWDEEQVARDLLQNFYDANRAKVASVTITAGANRVEVRAPAVFSLERLVYLGSEKDKEVDIGQYGEGFKAAAVCLVRDHDIEPVVISKNKAVRIRASSEAVAGTRLTPIIYDFYEATNGGYEGTVLLLDGCSSKLVRAMKDGLTHFWHEGNPLVGQRLWSNQKGDTKLYQASGQTGVIFYRRLKRGIIPNVPVVLVIDRECAPIERKTKQDRDRLAFGQELVEKAYKGFAGGVLRWDHAPARAVLELSKSVWQSGHGLLSVLADRTTEWTEKEAREVFGDLSQWFAGLPPGGRSSEFAEAMEIEREWREHGRKEVPSYFRNFGIPGAFKEAEARKKLVAQSARRRPTSAEEEAIGLLRETTNDLAPTIIGLFPEEKTRYFTLQRRKGSEQLQGAFSRHGWEMNRLEVSLAEALFEGEFSEALATFLHEHAHVVGWDGSRGFTDALTEMLATTIRMRDLLPKYERRWEEVRGKVEMERASSAEPAKARELSMSEAVEQMSLDELRDLVSRVPPAVLRRLLRPSDER